MQEKAQEIETRVMEMREEMEKNFESAMESIEDDDEKEVAQLKFDFKMMELEMESSTQQVEMAAMSEECAFMMNGEWQKMTFMVYYAMRKFVEDFEDEEKFNDALANFPDSGKTAVAKPTKAAAGKTRAVVGKHRMPGDTADLGGGGCGGMGCSIQ